MSQRTDRDLPQSTALLANLEETRREVVVPDEYLTLVETLGPVYSERLVSADHLITEILPQYGISTSRVPGLAPGSTSAPSEPRRPRSEVLRDRRVVVFGEVLAVVRRDQHDQASIPGARLEFLDDWRVGVGLV